MADAAFSRYSLRAWHDSGGKLKATASFVKADKSDVTLLVEEKRIQVPIEKLCARDQAYIRGVMQNQVGAQFALRRWNDISGKFKVTGSFVKADEAEVTLIVGVEKEIKESIKDLCDRDQEYIRKIVMLEQDEAQYHEVMKYEEKAEIPLPRAGDHFLHIKVKPRTESGGRPGVDDLEFLSIEYSSSAD